MPFFFFLQINNVLQLFLMIIHFLKTFMITSLPTLSKSDTLINVNTFEKDNVISTPIFDISAPNG